MRVFGTKCLLSLSLALGLSACANTKEGPALTTAPVEEAASVAEVAPAEEASPASPATMPDDADPAIWVLKDDDTTIYLFGTVHILKPGLTWFDEAVKDAFDSSDELVIEMITPDPTEMIKIVNKLAIDTTGKTLREKLTDDDRSKYEAALTSLELPVESFDALDPWFASINISLIPLMKGGYKTDSGVENDLKAVAETRNMKIIGLETPEQQLGFFDNLPEDVQIEFLNFTVETLGDMTAGMENMVAEWANANVDALGELMNAGLEDKILYDTLLANRNATWANWLDERMDRPGTVFVAVGAGHLAGESSLQQKLKDKNIIAERILY